MGEASRYPSWICSPCGARLGRRIPTLATWHLGDHCGWCGEATATTEPRDFGYPPTPVQSAPPPSGDGP